MPSAALPAGWVDTGITCFYRTKGSLALKFAYYGSLYNYSPPSPLLAEEIAVDAVNVTTGGRWPWQVYSYYVGGTGGDVPPPSGNTTPFVSSQGGLSTAFSGYIGIAITGPTHSGIVGHRMESIFFTPPLQANYTPFVSYEYNGATYPYSEVGGPFRLGYRWVLIPGVGSETPYYAQKHYQLEYGWFADNNSVVVLSFGGVSSPNLYYSSGGAVGTDPAPGVTGPYTSIGESQGSVVSHENDLSGSTVVNNPWTHGGTANVLWTSLSLNCSPKTYHEWLSDNGIDTSELDNTGGNTILGGCKGDGASGVTFYSYEAHGYLPVNTSCSWSVTPPWRFANDARCDWDGVYASGMPVVHFQDGIVSPPQADKTYPVPPSNQGYLIDGCNYYEIPVTSWSTHYKIWNGLQAFSIDPVWAASQNPPLWSDNDYDTTGQPIDPTRPVYESKFDLTLPVKGHPGRYSPEYLIFSQSVTVAGFAQIDVAGALASDSSQKVSWHAGGAVTGTLTTTGSSDTAGSIGGSVATLAGGMKGLLSGALTGAAPISISVSFSGSLAQLTGATPSLAISISFTSLSSAINASVSGYIILPLGAGGTGVIFIRLNGTISNSASAVNLAATVSGGGSVTKSSVNPDNSVTIYQAGLFGGGPVTGTLSGNASGTVSGQLCAAQQAYQPVTIKVPTGGIDIERPDGKYPPPSNWVTSDGTKLTVTENTSNTSLVVTATGASVTRTFAVDWSNYIDMTNSGPPNYTLTNADASVDGYKITKHNYKKDVLGSTQIVYPEDVWWWETYSYLQCNITAPSAGTLSLIVNYTTLDASDPHTTGSDRILNMSFTKTNGSATYSVPLSAGANPSVLLDLRFPSGGGPAYLGRITSLQLSGFAAGTYTINSLQLVVRQDPNASPAAAFAQSGYFKLGFGVPRQRKPADARSVDYSVPAASIDGSFAFGNIPDQANKNDEIGAHGGSVRYVDPITGAVSGVITDSQESASAFWADLNKIEGWNVSYDDPTYTAANQDDEGNALGTAGGEMAQFAWNILPFNKLAHVAGPPEVYQLKPLFGPIAAQVQIVQGLPIHIVAEHSIGGGIEAQDAPSGTRPTLAGAVQALDASSGSVITTVVPDWQGYCIVCPISANAVEVWLVSGG